jgi:pimeloyl-ACP methyl ester carboxylesterase
MNEKAALYFDECETLPNGNVDLGGIELGRAFLDDLVPRNLYVGVERFENPVLILHGSEDEAVPAAVGKRYADYYKNVAFHAVDGADHTFTRLKWRDELIARTVDFFR